MQAMLTGLSVCLIVVTACTRPDTSSRDSTQAAPTASRCIPEPDGKFVVTDTSVGRFSIERAAMGEVASSCSAADTVNQSMCCYMAMVVHLKRPGVVVQAEQEEPPDEASDRIKPERRVQSFEISGDSVYLADGQLLPANVAGMFQRFGPGFVDNPDYDDSDGPALRVCSMKNLSFRVTIPASVIDKKWRADTSARSVSTRIGGIVAMKRSEVSAQYCRGMVDSLPPE
jgi:hypothetical protein